VTERPVPDPAVSAAVADAHRREWAFVLAATARVAGDIDLAEECVQDAYVAALGAWSRTGVPRNPGAWLTTAARRRALDALRRDRTLRAKLPLLIEPGSPAGTGSQPAGGAAQAGLAAGMDAAVDTENTVDEVIADDRLRLVFTCCHPALAREAQVALTLRLVCGLTTAEIAQAFLVSEATMAARVTRAKKKIAAARIPYRVPGPAELPDRLDAVLTVVHLLYTTGHTAPAGPDLVRADLVERALGLARMLRELMPDEPEVRGLLALLLLTDARRATRATADGRLLLLEEQDRSQWDRAAIGEGTSLVTGALRGQPGTAAGGAGAARGTGPAGRTGAAVGTGAPVGTGAAGPARGGRFVLQAAIAAVHAEAPSYGDTDWPQLLRLYDELLKAWPTPVVALNRAVVHAMVDGPEAGLADIDRIERDGLLTGYRYLPAARADLLRRLGRYQDAARAYRSALDLTTGDAERAFLARRIAEVCAGPPGGD
jgi:RNA polymerase sigma-70 factor, ECF subfamily